MSARDIALIVLAAVAVLTTGWLIHDGTNGEAIAPIIALAGMAVGRVSGANTPPAAAAPVDPDYDAFTGDH